MPISLRLLSFSICCLALLILVYNIPLGLCIVAYLIFSTLLIESKYIDLLALLIVGIISITHCDYSAIISEIRWSIIYPSYHNFFTLLQYQLNNLTLIYTKGLLIVILLPLLLKNIANWQIHRLHQQSSKLRIKTEDQGQINGTLLGYSNVLSPIILSDHELNQHCLIVGTTGSGKTTTILNFVESSAQRGLPLIYLDGKGSVDLVDKMRTIANKYGRIFKVFTLQQHKNMSNLAGYNPFASGTPTQWKNRIMSLFAQVEGKGQEHFSLGEQNYINFVANILAKLKRPIDLRVILAFLENPDKLLAIAHEVDSELGHKLAKLHNDNDLQHLIGDVLKLLELFIYSDYGGLFNTLDMVNVIKIKQSMQNNEIVLFLFDAASYPEDTRKVAKMVINDINSSFIDLGEFKRCFCVFDEFASYASSNLAETISLQRSNGLHAIIGTQSITTVKLKSTETKRIAEELIACCNTYIVQQINHNDDAEILAKVMGTRKSYDITTQFTHSQNQRLKSVRESEEFKISPQIFKELRTGEAVIYRKAAAINPLKITINQNSSV